MGRGDCRRSRVTATARRPRWPGADLPGRRLFVAVPLPDDATARVAGLVESIRAEGLPGRGRDVRWVRLDGLHVTLRFLGPTVDDRIPAAIEATRAAAAGATRFEASIGGAGMFPSDHRPRAIWLGLRRGEASLAELARAVDVTLTAAGWTFDTKPFTAHLTLARSDGVPAGAAIGARLVELAEDLDVSFQADRIGLYESVTGGGPARYEPVDIVDLPSP
jgi:RNA 2',3'-cyclic 3'-phosphodiesterase